MQTTSTERTIDAGGVDEILVVDDMPANILAFRALLGDLDCGIAEARSGHAALRLLLENDYAVVLLDVQMPDMDGFETARWIRSRSRTRNLPIVFVTAHDGSNHAVRKAYELGAVDFLFKPIVPEALRAKVKAFVTLRRARVHAERQAETIRQLERAAAERRLASERERWMTERLRQENARKDEFLAMLAHELRNPLSPIVTGVELLKGRETCDPQSRELLERMAGQAHHVSRLVDDLLDVARITKGKIRLVRAPRDLARVVDAAAHAMRDGIEAREHTLSLQLEPDVRVHVDDVRISQITQNLLSNASRYTAPGGRIEVEVGREGGRAFLAVRDSGRGIEADMLDSIFEVFVQEREEGPGLGLGLPLVQRLAELHGGQVEVHSDGLGCGSTFTVWLPLDRSQGQQATHAPEPADAIEQAEDTTALDVVVIDDNRDVRELTAMLILSWGHRVRQAESGELGLELVRERAPDVIVVDIGMPGMTGYDVADAVREACGEARPRMVAVTGFGDSETRRKIEEHGFDAYLMKPAEPEELRQALRRMP